MDAAHELPPASLAKRVVRWIGDFERAMDMQPIDCLELRVARLERRMPVSPDVDSGCGASNALHSKHAGEL